MTTTADRNRVHGGTPAGGQFAVETRPEPDVSLAAPAGPGLWVRIEREGQDLMVGPYPDEETANRAMQDSLLIDGFCEEDALDCYIDDGQPTDADDQVIVDLSDRHHTGAPEPEDTPTDPALEEATARLAAAEHPIARFEARQDVDTLTGHLDGRLNAGGLGVTVTDRDSLEARIAIDDLVRETYPEALSWKALTERADGSFEREFNDVIEVTLADGSTDEVSIERTTASDALTEYAESHDANRLSYARPDFNGVRLRTYLEGRGVQIENDQSPQMALAWALGEGIDYSDVRDIVKVSRPGFDNHTADDHIRRFLALRGVQPAHANEAPSETLGWALGDKVAYEDLTDLA